jgi:hypothetical protein
MQIGDRICAHHPPHGGARRSHDSTVFLPSSRGRFSTDDVPSATSIKEHWVRTREDFPGFYWQLINLLTL